MKPYFQPWIEGLAWSRVAHHLALIMAAGESHAVGGECAVVGVSPDHDGVAIHGSEGGLFGHGALDALLEINKVLVTLKSKLKLNHVVAFIPDCERHG